MKRAVTSLPWYFENFRRRPLPLRAVGAGLINQAVSRPPREPNPPVKCPATRRSASLQPLLKSIEYHFPKRPFKE